MFLKDLVKYYGTSYMFNKYTGMSHNCWKAWETKGYIPLKSQLRIQRYTNGQLKANFEHTNEV